MCEMLNGEIRHLESISGINEMMNKLKKVRTLYRTLIEMGGTKGQKPMRTEKWRLLMTRKNADNVFLVKLGFTNRRN